MKIAVTLSGQWRFSRSAVESLAQCVVQPLRRRHEVGVYIHAWSLGVPAREELEFMRGRLPVHCMRLDYPAADYSSPFDGFEHPHAERYRSQFESLYRVFQLITCDGFEPDLILRTRMDLLYLSELVMPDRAKEQTVYVPPVEGHMETPFGPTLVNDQVALGDRATMSAYMQLGKRIGLGDRSDVPKRSGPDIDGRGVRDLKSIEGILCDYLRAESIKVRRLNLFYTLERMGTSRRKIFCAALPMFVYGPMPNRLSPWLVVKAFAILKRLAPQWYQG